MAEDYTLQKKSWVAGGKQHWSKREDLPVQE